MCQWEVAYPWGFDFGPYLVDGQQGGGGGLTKGLVKPESPSAPMLLRTFFKGSEVNMKLQGSVSG